MEEIKLWAIGGSQIADLKPTGQTETEEMLEDTLVSRPDMLLEDLTLVGRQTPTEGGPLDLLGVDGDGRLVVFELKRGTLTREAVAQVIDYASFLDSMDLDALTNHISQRSGNYNIEKIEDFSDWYRQNFEEGELESLKPVRMFLVGLGVDDTTERMVRFLTENTSMDISLLTYHGFHYGGKTILAKQVEVEISDPNGPPRKSRGERWKKSLNDRIEEFDVGELMSLARDVFRENWLQSREITVTRGINIRLRDRVSPESSRHTRRAYARVDPGRGRIRIVFYPRAVELSKDAFKQPIEEVPYETWPRNRNALEDANTEIQFLLTSDDWETHKEKLTGLVQSLYEAWQNKDSGG